VAALRCLAILTDAGKRGFPPGQRAAYFARGTTMNIELADTKKRTPIRLVKRRQGLLARLFAPVDIASLAFFRVAFGAVMLWEVWRYFNYGWISRYYIEPGFHFTYYGFDWVRPWPGDGMYYHFSRWGCWPPASWPASCTASA